MNINADRIASIAGDLKKEIRRGYSECGMVIGEIEGVTFRLVALDEREAYDQGFDSPVPSNECITQ